MLRRLTINIFEAIGDPSAISSNDGNIVFKRIDEAIAAGVKVTLDFSNINLITSAFLNAAIGQLYSKYTSDDLNSQLEISNLAPEDAFRLRKVIQRAKEYFNDKKGLDNIYKEAFSNG